MYAYSFTGSSNALGVLDGFTHSPGPSGVEGCVFFPEGFHYINIHRDQERSTNIIKYLWISLRIHNYLVVSTHLKNMLVKLNLSPQAGMKITNNTNI